MLFCNYLPLERIWPFIWSVLNLFHPSTLCPMICWNWPSGSGENFKFFVMKFRNYLPLEMGEKNLNHLHQMLLCVKFGWNWWPNGSGKEDENVRSLQKDRQRDRETDRRTDRQTDRRRTLGDQESSHELYAQVSYKSYGSDPNLHRQKNTTFTSITVEYFILEFQIKKVFTEICIALYKICINFQNWRVQLCITIHKCASKQ